VKEMGRKPNRHCGTDIHESVIVAAIVDRDDEIVEEQSFANDVIGHMACVRWLKQNRTRHVGMESTGVYWKAFAHTLISYGIDVKVGNALLMKNIPGKKTDRHDARRLARLLRDGYIPESNILSKESDDFRTMVRARLRLVKERTAVKNRISALIAKCGFRMYGISDKFGRFGRKVLETIAAGDNIDPLFNTKRATKLGYSKEEFLAILETHLTQPVRKQLQLWLTSLNHFDEQIKTVEDDIATLINCDEGRLRQIQIIKSIPGFADIASPTALAELENILCFPTPGRFSAYCGLVPVVYQTGEKVVDGKVVQKVTMGRVRQICNKRLKWILIQAATTVARQKSSPLVAPLQRFYRRILRRHSGRYKKAKAVVALAHKLAKIIWTLLVKDELYHGDEDSTKSFSIRRGKRVSQSDPEPVLSQVIDVLANQGLLSMRSGLSLTKSTTS
jgi:transposase